MTRGFRYQVGAPPDRVVAVLASATKAESVVGFAMSDRSGEPFVGKVTDDGSFRLRRPRGFSTPPRVAYVAGGVQRDAVGSLVVGSFRVHPLVRVAQVVWILLLLAFSAVVLPASFARPELLWVIAVIGLPVGLLLLLFWWIGSRDQIILRRALTDVLGRAGRVSETE